MAHITFSEIMNFYPRHNQSVYDDLKKAYQGGNVLPFVGAGLSVFCGYQSWPNVLRELAKFLYDGDRRIEIEKKIAAGELLEAAQEIQDAYPRILTELQKIISYEKIEKCGEETWYASAAYSLPYLFPNSLVLTTNFDRVLEEVYGKCRHGFGNVITPYEPALLTQARQNNSHCLFKLHGDIGPEVCDIAKLVFTRKQYDVAYAKDGALMKELPLWFQNKKLLFLGCSLAMDKTMEVLQQVTADNPGLAHFAILPCRSGDVERRCTEMGKLGISAIFYPESCHEAVRVILERLLEETNHAEYAELERRTRSCDQSVKTERRFMYDADFISFVGRGEEQELLTDFLQAPEKAAWWAVTGPGGMGKSRLLYEFTRKQKAEGWTTLWLKDREYTDLAHRGLPVEPCIIVADDVQAHIQEMGSWLPAVLKTPRSEKLRVILMEREGEGLGSAEWVERLRADDPYDDTVPDQCYDAEFLTLEPMSDEELGEIMMDFAKTSGKPLSGKEHAERLLQTLKNIDGELRRPIYAMAITDAWCANEDPTRWNKEQVLEQLVKRELKLSYEQLQKLSGGKGKEKLRAELENLLAEACVHTVMPVDDVEKERYPKFYELAGTLDMTLSELLRQIGVVREIEVTAVKRVKGKTEKCEKIIEAVLLDCPDLIREYLVLRQVFDQGNHELLLPEGWEDSFDHMFFLSRVLIDYPEKLTENAWFWEVFFKGKPKGRIFKRLYSGLLFGVTVKVQEMTERACMQLEELCTSENDDVEILVEYAKGLVNLSTRQSLEERVLTIGRLRLLHEKMADNKEIAEEYGKGLFNLLLKQSGEIQAESVEKLRMLHEKFAENEIIAEIYGKGLSEQSRVARIQNIEKLCMLREEFASSEKIAEAYGRGIFFASLEQQGGAITKSVEELRLLHEEFTANERIAEAYGKSLFNLSIDQTIETQSNSVERLRLLYKKFVDKGKIAEIYGKCLVNLSAVQTGEALKQSIKELRQMYEKFEDNERFADLYASSLVNFALKLGTQEEIEKTIEWAAEVVERYPQNTEIQLSYAQTQFNLTLKQEGEALRQTVARLREYLVAHPEANKGFQEALDTYLGKHPEHTERYSELQV